MTSRYYYDIFADDTTNNIRAAQFDELAESLSIEARARLLFDRDTLMGAGMTELAAKVTMLSLCRYLTLTDQQRQAARMVGLQMNADAKEPMERQDTRRKFKFMGGAL